jgi:diguanylate cyclase (GGDEF)-like protein
MSPDSAGTCPATTNFARASELVVSYLSANSGVAGWVLVRGEAGGAQTLATTLAGESRQPEQIGPIDVGITSHCRVTAPIKFPDGTPFGTLVGFDPVHLDDETLAGTRKLAGVFADLLGAMAASDLTLAGERRQAEVTGGLTDPLTGLATRQGWEDRLRRDERLCCEFGEGAAIALIELDELERLNERRGHHAGDEQLRLAGTVVREVLASRHFAARVTGNRLGVLMISIGPTELDQLERSLRHTLSAVEVSAIIGVARRRPDRGLDGAMLDAEAALSRSSAGGRTGTTDHEGAIRLLAAIENGEIKAYFQPIVDLRSGEVVAVEALARWSSVDGIREPDRFLKEMQQAGLLGALFDCILDDGLGNLIQFRAVSPNLRLAVNVEFDSVVETTLLTRITERLNAHGLPPTSLSIELGERQTFDLPGAIREDLIAVAELGVTLMLDDFGTGFASLETLTSLPISGVKLDRRFTSQVVSGDREPVVVKAMIAMAIEAGLTVIAEGIETQTQCDRLVRMGCRLGQGYLFAVPQPADTVAAVLSAPLVSTF